MPKAATMCTTLQSTFDEEISHIRFELADEFMSILDVGSD